ncbi:hemolysin family protein [bacterium]|nr:hemolysin family protein [bacterium]
MSRASIQMWFKRMFRPGATESDAQRARVIEERLEEMFDEAEREGLIDVESGEMFQGIIDLPGTPAGEVMVPRINVAAVADDETIAEVLARMRDSGHSRIPIFTGSLDKIIGIIHAKDLLRHWGRTDGEIRLGDIARKPFFVGEDIPLDDLLREFQARKVQIAVVVNEYGGTSGLITLEDIFEVIVGDIKDEFDRSEPDLIEEVADGWVRVGGRFNAHDFFENFDRDKPDGSFNTIGGWIVDRVGRIPKPGETFALDVHEVRIEEADRRRVTRALVRLAPQTGREKSED